MNTAEKRELVGQLGERMQRARACVLAEYKGLTVADLTALRRSLDAHEAEFKIAKNRLTKIAIQDRADFAPLSEHLRGPTGVAWLYGDLAQGIKQVLDFQKEHGDFKIKAAVMHGSSLTPAELKEIAGLPSKEVLLARLIGTLIAPHQRLMGVLQGVPRALVLLLAAMQEKKEKSG